MEWSFLFFFNSVLLGVGLAMDAFSVSVASALNEHNMKKRRMGLIAGVFAAFQFLMPMVGWICVHTILSYFTVFSRFIPWIALALLLYIGGGMLIDGIKCKGEEKREKMNMGQLMLMGVATSIDALSVGFTIAEYPSIMALVCSLIIAAVTFAICAFGLLLGKRIGDRFSNKASILGGAILIVIGLEIFITGVF